MSLVASLPDICLDSLCGVGGLGLIIMSNLNRVGLVVVGLDCDNYERYFMLDNARLPCNPGVYFLLKMNLILVSKILESL